MQKEKLGESPWPQLLCTLYTSMLCGDIPREVAPVLETCSSFHRNNDQGSIMKYYRKLLYNVQCKILWKEKILIYKIYKNLHFSSFPLISFIYTHLAGREMSIFRWSDKNHWWTAWGTSAFKFLWRSLGFSQLMTTNSVLRRSFISLRGYLSQIHPWIAHQ